MATKATKIMEIAYHQGISDYMRYKTRCPIYWKGTPEGQMWQVGYNYGMGYNKI